MNESTSKEASAQSFISSGSFAHAKTAKPLCVRQVCLFFIAFLPITKIFTLPSVLAETAGRDSWLSALALFALDITTALLLVMTIKRENADVAELCERFFGKVGLKIIYSVYLVSLLAKTLLPVVEQRDYVNLTLYVTRPDLLVFLPFFIIAFYLCTKKLRALGRCAEILFVLTLTGLIFITVLAVPNFDAGALLPVGVSGAKTVLSSAYKAAPWFGDCVYLVFFVGNVKKEKRQTLKITLAYSAAALASLIFIVLFYGTFSAIAFRQRFALTEIAKYSAVINNVERFDYFGIFLLLASGVVSSVLPLYFAARVAEKLFNVKQRWICPIAVTVLIAVPVILLSEYYASIEKFLTSAGSALFLLTNNLFPIALSVTTVFYARKKEKTHEIS